MAKRNQSTELEGLKEEDILKELEEELRQEDDFVELDNLETNDEPSFTELENLEEDAATETVKTPATGFNESETDLISKIKIIAALQSSTPNTSTKNSTTATLLKLNTTLSPEQQINNLLNSTEIQAKLQSGEIRAEKLAEYLLTSSLPMFKTDAEQRLRASILADRVTLESQFNADIDRCKQIHRAVTKKINHLTAEAWSEVEKATAANAADISAWQGVFGNAGISKIAIFVGGGPIALGTMIGTDATADIAKDSAEFAGDKVSLTKVRGFNSKALQIAQAGEDVNRSAELDARVNHDKQIIRDALNILSTQSSTDVAHKAMVAGFAKQLTDGKVDIKHLEKAGKTFYQQEVKSAVEMIMNFVLKQYQLSENYREAFTINTGKVELTKEGRQGLERDIKQRAWLTWITQNDNDVIPWNLKILDALKEIKLVSFKDHPNETTMDSQFNAAYKVVEEGMFHTNAATKSQLAALGKEALEQCQTTMLSTLTQGETQQDVAQLNARLETLAQFKQLKHLLQVPLFDGMITMAREYGETLQHDFRQSNRVKDALDLLEFAQTHFQTGSISEKDLKDVTAVVNQTVSTTKAQPTMEKAMETFRTIMSDLRSVHHIREEQKAAQQNQEAKVLGVASPASRTKPTDPLQKKSTAMENTDDVVRPRRGF